MAHAILLVSCPDRKGITASVTGFVFSRQGNIVHADQHIDEQSNTFFMRIEWDLEGFSLTREEIVEEFSQMARGFDMDWQLYFSDARPKTAVFVSKPLHCLADLLFRYEEGQFPCEFSMVVSNHAFAEPLAGRFSLPFHQFEMTPENKREVERQQMALLEDNTIDLIILARYHQLLSPDFVNRYRNRIINIHHSFLPAFAGRDPYARAYGKGVKIIGATSHYVTEHLDEGPIIEQDTVRVSHRNSLSDLIRLGQDLEKGVLGRAVLWHLQRKVLCYGNKTVVFD